MKKNSYYLLIMLMMAIVSVGFVSCGSDDDDNNGGGAGGTGTLSGSIVGTWKIVKTAGYDANGKLYGETVEKDLPYYMFYQFQENGVCAYFEYYLDPEDYWEDGNGQKHAWDIDYGRYTYSGNVLIVDGERMEVLNLTSTELKVKFKSENSNYSYDVVTMRRASDSDVPSTGGGDNDDDDEIDTPTPPGSDDTGSYASNILGTWQWINTTEYYSNGTVESYDTTNDDFYEYTRFNKNKTMDIYDYYYQENRWNVEHLKYGISGNTLTIIDVEYEIEINYEIVSLTHSELIIGERENADLYITLTLKKVSDSVLDGAEK